MSEMLEHALQYLKAGYAVVPVKPKSKGMPLVKWREFQDRLPTEQEVEQWWTDTPNANIAMITGRISGVVAFDEDGPEADKLIRENGGFPVCPQSKTGKGHHYLFRHPGFTVKNDVNTELTLDIRGDGAYILAPPSIHPNGKRYEWVPGMSPFAVEPPEMRQWQLDYIKLHCNGNRSNEIGWQDEAIQGVSEGHRNDTAAKLAGRYIAKGLTDAEIRPLLLAWNQNNSPPLPEDEITRTLQSVRDTHDRKHPEPSKITTPDLIPNKLFKTYEQYVTPISESPLVFHIFTLAHTISCLTGRGRWIQQGEDTHYPNLYTLIVARSALFKKTSTAGLCQMWLNRLECTERFLGHVGSPEGLFTGLESNDGTGFLYYSELGTLLAQSSGATYMSGILDVLNDLYDCPRYYKKVLAGGTREVQNAFLNVLAASQLASLSQYVKESILLSGFLPRFTIVYSEDIRDHIARRPTPNKILQNAILKHLNSIRQRSETPGPLDLTKAAWAMFETWGHTRYQDARDADPKLQPLYGRIETHCLKYAIIIHMASERSDGLITTETVKPAMAWADFVLQSYTQLVMHELTFTESDRKLKKVSDIIKSKGTASHRDVANGTRYGKRVLDDKIQTLAAMGKVRIKAGERGGKLYEWIA